MTRHPDRHETVFEKSTWGTNRYVCKTDNPVGRTLAVLSVVLPVVMLLLLFSCSPD